jgi:hypothetical protein
MSMRRARSAASRVTASACPGICCERGAGTREIFSRDVQDLVRRVESGQRACGRLGTLRRDAGPGAVDFGERCVDITHQSAIKATKRLYSPAKPCIMRHEARWPQL